jgi:hypothetical protein
LQRHLGELRKNSRGSQKRGERPFSPPEKNGENKFGTDFAPSTRNNIIYSGHTIIIAFDNAVCSLLLTDVLTSPSSSVLNNESINATLIGRFELMRI